MANTYLVHDNYLEFTLRDPASLELRLKQIARIYAMIVKTRRLFVLIKLHKPAGLFSAKSVKRMVAFLHDQDWGLRKIGLVPKIAIYTEHQKREDFDLHQKLMDAKDLRNIQFFDDKRSAVNWLNIQSPLGDVVAYYQPLVDLTDRHIVGYEAFARKIVKNKVVPTEQWLPKFLIEPKGGARLSKHMLDQAGKAVERLSGDQFITINIDAIDLDSGMLVSIVDRYASTELRERIAFEINERQQSFGSDPVIAAALRDQGYRIVIDEFGHSWSRLLDLVDLQPEWLKLSPSWVARLQEPSVMAFTRHLVHWAKDQNIKVLAKGIETAATVKHCLAAGVQFGQGFLFSPAMPIERVSKPVRDVNNVSMTNNLPRQTMRPQIHASRAVH